MAHAFITSFKGDDKNAIGTLQPADRKEKPREIFPEIEAWLKKVVPVLGVVEDEVRMGELVSFAAYAVAFPDAFLALVDTYHVLRYNLKPLIFIRLNTVKVMTMTKDFSQFACSFNFHFLSKQRFNLEILSNR